MIKARLQCGDWSHDVVLMGSTVEVEVLGPIDLTTLTLDCDDIPIENPHRAKFRFKEWRGGMAIYEI